MGVTISLGTLFYSNNVFTNNIQVPVMLPFKKHNTLQQEVSSSAHLSDSI